MRQKLKEIGTETRERYKGTVSRCGIKFNEFKRYVERTVILNNVIRLHTAEKVSEHVCLNVGKTLSKLDLKAGDEINFNARVGTYRKGKSYDRIGFKLKRLTHLEVIRSDREVSEDEITTGKPATFEEWQDIQEMKYLEDEYTDDNMSIDYDYESSAIDRIKELKALFNRRYFKADEKTV